MLFYLTLLLTLMWKLFSAAAAAKLLQSCPTLCDPIDGSPPGCAIPGILQARTLEWVAISFSNAWKWSRSVVSDSSWPQGLQPTRLLRPWDSPGKSTGVGCHLLQDTVSFLKVLSGLLPPCKSLLCWNHPHSQQVLLSAWPNFPLTWIQARHLLPYFIYSYFMAVLCGMWDLSSLTRDQTCAPL